MSPFFASLFSQRHYPSKPLLTVAGYPIRTVPFVLVCHLIALVVIACSLGNVAGLHSSWLRLLEDQPALVAQGEWWRILTYPFLNAPSFWFFLELFFFYLIGRELEVLLGSRTLFAFYSGLVVVGALLLQLASSFGVSGSFQGSSVLHFSIFAAFVMVYPGIPFFFGLEARWALLGLTLLSVLELIAAHQQAGLILFLGSLCFTSLVMKYLGFRVPLWQGLGSSFSANFARFFSKVTKKRQRFLGKGTFSGEKKPREQKQITIQDPHASSSSQYRQQRPFSSQSTTMAFFSSPTNEHEEQETEYQETLYNTTDQLLKKVGEKGLESLSREERAHLDQASRVLLQREKGSQFFQQES